MLFIALLYLFIKFVCSEICCLKFFTGSFTCSNCVLISLNLSLSLISKASTFCKSVFILWILFELLDKDNFLLFNSEICLFISLNLVFSPFNFVKFASIFTAFLLKALISLSISFMRDLASLVSSSRIAPTFGVAIFFLQFFFRVEFDRIPIHPWYFLFGGLVVAFYLCICFLLCLVSINSISNQ